MENYRIDATKLDTFLGRIQAMQGRRVTYKELADRAGLCAHTISGIRAGRTRGAGTTAVQLASAIRSFGVNCSTDSLLIETNE